MTSRLRHRQRPMRPVPARRITLVALLVLAAQMSGCASSAPGTPSTFDKALDLFGLQSKPAVPPPTMESLAEAARLPKKLTLRIHAGDVLNTDGSGRSLSLILKWYRLKEADAFLQAPYDAFKDGADKSAPLQGLIDEREIVLTPGQKYEVVETLPLGTAYVGLVALFRAPDAQRWRFAFETQAAAKSGLTIGAHGCALSVAEGVAVNASPESLRLAGVHCR